MLSPNPVEVFITRVQFPEADTCDIFFPELGKDLFERKPFEALQKLVQFDIQQGPIKENGLEYEFQLFVKK